ncbi:MAG TPA: twin-arginine translocation signal domain-containing protein [Verrucomicrobiae bacterium]|nr:twin-arginine translocation signal domain-containing protein [Verrucomicrobiae bacterium]
MNRRQFIKTSVAAAGATIGGITPFNAANPAPTPASSKLPVTIALPISVAPLAQRELDPMFDDMRRRAGVNALFPFIYSHEPHRAGVASENFHGGNYATPHMQFYKDIPLTFQDLRAPEFGDVDVLDRIIPVARKHGIRVFCFLLEDNARPATVPHREALYEVDHHGRRADRHPGGLCYNNPLYQRFALGLVEDYARSYDIAGIMWGSERQSGLLNALGLSQSRGQDPGRATCFCEFCQKKGASLGINVDRARSGFGAVEKFVTGSRAGNHPRDGFFAAFWRVLMQYPELLAWENLWVNSRHEFQAALYARIKSINPSLQSGWHVWHNMSFSPFQRAEEDFAGMTGYSDFIRPALYNNVAGGRFLNFVKGAHESVYGDLPPEEILELLCRQLHYDEAPFDKLAATGLSADYVERETRRAVEAVAGSATQIWPGVEIDVPADAGMGHCTPESVGRAVKSAFRGGAHGIILSRNYMEMKPENLSGAGEALRAVSESVTQSVSQ